MRKALVICILAISITLMVNVNAYADDELSPTPSEAPTPTPDPFTQLQIIKGGSTDMNTMMYYYHNVLNVEQQKIARFLIGSYNYMYLNARGFSYQNINDLDDLIQRFDEFAELIVGLDTNYVELNTSRWSTNFQIYIASIITYAGNQNVTFDVWKNTLRPNLVIPYTSEALDAWTDYYNDPSNNGITSFGSEARDWQSGNTYPYLFGDYAFSNQYAQEDYTNLVLNRAPVLWSNPKIDYRGRSVQMGFSFQGAPLINTLYVLRSDVSYNYFRFGDYEGNFYSNQLPYNGNVKYFVFENGSVYTDGYGGARFEGSTIFWEGYHNITELIEHAFYVGPVHNFTSNGMHPDGGWYPYISHVVLVDNLDTLSNRQDLYNDWTLGIIEGSDWIRKPNPNRQIVWVLDDNAPMVIESDPNDPNVVNLINPVDSDFSNQIVNNTVINNYDIVAPGVQINVPTDWFESDGNYLEYSYNYGLPFFVFIGDLFLTLGELRIFILGGIILMIVAGVLNKFLL